MKIILNTLCGCSRVCYDGDAYFTPPASIWIPLPRVITVSGTEKFNGKYNEVREFQFDQKAGDSTYVYREKSTRCE